MLTARRTAAASVLALLALLAPAPSAVADGPGGSVQCPPKELDCDLTAVDPGTAPGTPVDSKPAKPGKGGRGSSAPECAIDGKAVPCSSDMGTFNHADACYWRALDPQPGPEDPLWTFATGVPATWKPGAPGKLYNVTCPGAGRELAGGTMFSASAPAAAPTIDPEVVARQAVESMRLTGPVIANPRAEGTYVVGMPFWMWATPSPTTYGPVTASATAGGVTVSATAKVTWAVWDMGDGETVTCPGPGTKYTADHGKNMSPDCGHRYRRSSTDEPDSRYAGSTTTTWSVDWTVTAGGAQTGTLTTTRETAWTARVGEVQVLNTN
ncbi:ATP/GTP-binding protein (plasmid) [Streptomyces sp. NBC_01116]|uniref:ATP/GTP-binding protein n=1 Tax=Streptomyces sp. NBC_01116 TaxID=2903752 RepID=UPI002F916EF0